MEEERREKEKREGEKRRRGRGVVLLLKPQKKQKLFVWKRNVGEKDMFNVHFDLNLNVALWKT